MHRFRDLTGLKFGRLTVLARRNSNHPATWMCQCVCGNIKVFLGGNLTNGYTKSCGCLHKERASEANVKHGLCRTPEYMVWAGMLQRCNNPNAPHYECYGGRGIKVCKEWTQFEKFLRDMGKRPSSKHSINRINNDLGYGKSNCIWSTRKEQMRNKRDNHNITINGETHCLSCWCEMFEVPVYLVHERIKRLGWNPIKALRHPVRNQKKGQK